MAETDDRKGGDCPDDVRQFARTDGAATGAERRHSAERSAIARAVLDLLAGEIMRRLKRRFPDPPTPIWVRGRRRKRAEGVSPAASPQRPDKAGPRRLSAPVRILPFLGSRRRDGL